MCNQCAQTETSVHEDTNSYWKLYSQYRHHWPGYILIALILSGEVAIILGTRSLWLQSDLEQKLP